jgi:hypothetical protein
MFSILASVNDERPVRALVNCPACGSELELHDIEGGRSERCLKCEREIYGMILPRAVAEPARPATPQIAGSQEATCFFHDDKAAERSCDVCGRFVCALCDLELEARHLCPNCFNQQMAAGKLETMKTREVLHDSLALGIAFLSWLFWMFGFVIVAIPAIIYLMVRYWSEPRNSPVPRWPWRYIAALGVVVVPVILFIAFVFNLSRATARPRVVVHLAGVVVTSGGSRAGYGNLR